MQTLTLRPGADRRILRGHLWIFSNEVKKPPSSIPEGADVRVVDSRGRLLGSGTFHPRTLILIRLHAFQEETPLDRTLIDKRIRAAWETRKRWLDESGIRACRLVNAEGDLLPGLIVDRYDEFLTVQCFTAAMDQRTDLILDVLTEQFNPRGILLRNDAPARAFEGLPEEVALGCGEIQDRVKIRLGPLRFWVDLRKGQKTGFYFDQRQNYGLIQPFCRDGKVLDAFCFTGAWAAHAAHWGAREVLAVDSSEHALLLAQKTMQENHLANVELRRADVLESLKTFVREQERFDVIILDPPAHAKSRKQADQAFKGHLNLHKWALRCLEPGGILVTCCCSSYVEPDRFLDSLVLASRHTGARLRVLAARGQGMDHPWVPAMPETAYLKVYMVQRIEETNRAPSPPEP